MHMYIYMYTFSVCTHVYVYTGADDGSRVEPAGSAAFKVADYNKKLGQMDFYDPSQHEDFEFISGTVLWDTHCPTWEYIIRVSLCT